MQNLRFLESSAKNKLPRFIDRSVHCTHFINIALYKDNLWKHPMWVLCSGQTVLTIWCWQVHMPHVFTVTPQSAHERLTDDDAIRQVPVAVSAPAGNAFILTARDDTFLPYAGLPGSQPLTQFMHMYCTRYFPVILHSYCQRPYVLYMVFGDRIINSPTSSHFDLYLFLWPVKARNSQHLLQFRLWHLPVFLNRIRSRYFSIKFIACCTTGVYILLTYSYSIPIFETCADCCLG